MFTTSSLIIFTNIRFDIITIFPHIFDSYFNESIIKRAREKKLADIRIHDLRDFVKVAPRQARGNLPLRRQVDDRPYGGGPGMILKIEPLIKAISSILRMNPKQILSSKFKKSKTKIILFSVSGRLFDAKTARSFAKNYDHIIMICGHYEGVDARLKKVIHALGFMLQEASIGPYVLTGGELPAMVVVDAISRYIPGVLGKEESLEEKRHGIGVPMYTRPEEFIWPPSKRGKRGKKYSAPKVLLSGNHQKIENWRKTHKFE